MLGCAGIGKKFCISTAEASNATLVAVASRSREKAEAYIAEHCPGAKAYGSYDELLDDPDVQAVYIPLPTVGRGDWVVKAAAKRKHVLCEKPLEGSLRAAQRMVAACREAGVQFMDNTMFMHHDRMAAVQRAISEGGLVGPAKHVVSAFSLPLGDDDAWSKGNIRTKRDQEPLGCLGDLGWYCVRFTMFAFGYDLPEAVSCHFLEESDDGVPLKVMASMRFSGGRTAAFDCSFKNPWRQWVEVSGKELTLTMDDFVIAGRPEGASFTISRVYPGEKDLFFPKEVVKTEALGTCLQHVRLVEKFASLALAGAPEDFWPTVAMQTQTVVAALVASARRKAEWVQPRAPQEEKPAAVAKATFCRVADITPDSKSLNLMVKVVSVAEGGDAVLGDASGAVVLSRRGDGAHDAVLREGASLVVRNASTKVVRGFIRLVVDRWGRLDASPEPFGFTPKTDNDVSSTEYELVKEGVPQIYIGDRRSRTRR